MGAHPSAPSGVARVHPGRRHRRRPGPRARPAVRGPVRPPAAVPAQGAVRRPGAVHPGAPLPRPGRGRLPRREPARPAPGDPARNYVDDWPKPELLCALTPFEVLAGLRPPADAAALLRALAVPALQPLAAELQAAAPARPGRRTPGRHRPAGPQPRPGRHPRMAASLARRPGRLGRGRLRHPGLVRQPLRRGLRRGRARGRGSPRRPRRGGHAADAARRAGPRPGGVHAGRGPARLPPRHRHRGAGQLRQHGPGRPDRQSTSTSPSCWRCSTRPSRCRSWPPARWRTGSPGSTLRPRSSACTWSISSATPCPCPARAPGSCCARRVPRCCAASRGSGPRSAGASSCFVSAADGAVSCTGQAHLFLATVGPNSAPRENSFP